MKPNVRGKGNKPAKTAMICFRLSEETKSRLENRAKAAGESLTDYLVMKGLEDV